MKIKHILLLMVLFIIISIISISSPPANLGHMYQANNLEEYTHEYNLGFFLKFSDSFFDQLQTNIFSIDQSINHSQNEGGSDTDLKKQKLFYPWELWSSNLQIGEMSFSWQPPQPKTGGLTVDPGWSQTVLGKEIESDIKEITGKGFLEALRKSERTSALHRKIKTHEVRPGENLWTIASKYDINIDTLIGANDIKNMNNIMPGDELTILPVKGIKYKIGPGDTLADIVENYELDPKKVKLANSITHAEDLKSGDTLILPGASPDFGYQDRLNQRFIRPVDGRVTSPFGPRWGSHHDGIDYAAPIGTPVKAAGGGRVVHVGYSSGYGRTVIIEHQEGMRTLYSHLKSYNVNVGQRVNRGQTIARTGNSGRSTGPHLHFEVRVNGRPVNPENYLRD